jgi:hypothetical protein
LVLSLEGGRTVMSETKFKYLLTNCLTFNKLLTFSEFLSPLAFKMRLETYLPG